MDTLQGKGEWEMRTFSKISKCEAYIFIRRTQLCTLINMFMKQFHGLHLWSTLHMSMFMNVHRFLSKYEHDHARSQISFIIWTYSWTFTYFVQHMTMLIHVHIYCSTYERGHERSDATFMNVFREPFTKRAPKTVNTNPWCKVE